MPRVQLLHRWLLAQSPHQQCRDHGELQLMESLHVGPMAWLWYLTQYTYSASVPSLQHPTCDAHAVCSCPTKLHHITNPETPYYASISCCPLTLAAGVASPCCPSCLTGCHQQSSRTATHARHISSLKQLSQPSGQPSSTRASRGCPTAIQPSNNLQSGCV